jgi:hypothetical protein
VIREGRIPSFILWSHRLIVAAAIDCFNRIYVPGTAALPEKSKFGDGESDRGF